MLNRVHRATSAGASRRSTRNVRLAHTAQVAVQSQLHAHQEPTDLVRTRTGMRRALASHVDAGSIQSSGRRAIGLQPSALPVHQVTLAMERQARPLHRALHFTTVSHAQSATIVRKEPTSRRNVQLVGMPNTSALRKKQTASSAK